MSEQIKITDKRKSIRPSSNLSARMASQLGLVKLTESEKWEYADYVNNDIANKLNTDSSNISATEKLAKAKIEFNKVFGGLKNLNITDEYVKVRLKISNLPSSKRSILLAYILLRRQNEPKFAEVYDEIDKRIALKLKEVTSK